MNNVVVAFFSEAVRAPKICMICIEIGEFFEPHGDYSHAVWAIYTNGDLIRVWSGDNIEAARSAAEKLYPGVPVDYRGPPR